MALLEFYGSELFERLTSFEWGNLRIMQKSFIRGKNAEDLKLWKFYMRVN